MAVFYWTAVAQEEISHRTEIRHGRPVLPAAFALLVVGGVVALLVLGRDGTGVAPAPAGVPLTTVPATPTSETLTTTSPPTVPPALGLVATVNGVEPVSTETAPRSDRDGSGSGPLPPIAAVVATDGIVVVRTSEGDVLAGRPGDGLTLVVPGALALHPSNEPGHVWIEAEREVALVMVPGGGTVTVLDIGDARVLGPASFGVVTVDGDGSVRWHRPSFAPAPVDLPDDRTASDAGGDFVLAETPSARPGSRRVELWRIADGRFWQSFEVAPGVEGAAVLASNGSHVAVPQEGGWSVRDSTTTYERGELPAGPTPVWLGWRRFGAVHDGRALLSDGTTVGPDRPWLALAEQAPSRGS
jgi:hypothetical protein